MTGVGDDSRGRLTGRPFLVVGFLLAIGATLALVLSNDLRYLRLAIVAALWAALIGAFLAVRYRKQAAQSEDAVAEAQAVYELELEREIAARREYELEMEAEQRSASDTRSRDELAALRAEVTALRESLQGLFGGEVLLERVALTAQATRMRSLADENRLVTGPPGNGKKKPAQLLAGKKPVGEGNERPTELIDRAMDERRRGANGKPANGKPGKSRFGRDNDKREAPVAESTQQIGRPAPLSERRGPVPPVDPALNAAQRELKAAELRAEAARRQAASTSQPMNLPRQEEIKKARPEPAAAEPTRRDVPRPNARPEPPIRRPEPPPARREASRTDIRPAEVSRSDLPRVERSMPAVRPGEVSRPDIPRVERSMPGMRPAQLPGPGIPRVEMSRPGIPRVEMSRPDIPRVEMSRPDIPRVERSMPGMRPVEMSRPDIPRVERSGPDLRQLSSPDLRRPQPPMPPVPPVEMSRPDIPRVGRPGGIPPKPLEGTRPEMQRPERGRPAASVPPPMPKADRPVSDLSAAFPNRDDFAERQRPNRPMPPDRSAKPPMPRDPSPSRTDLPPVPPPKPVPDGLSRPNLPPVDVPPTTPVPSADSRPPSRLEQFSRADMQPVEQPRGRHGEPETPVNPTLPEEIRNYRGSGGRRRKPDDSRQLPAVPPPVENGGGRRRRPDGEPPAWDGMVAERASMSRRGMTPVDPDEAEYNGNGNRNGNGNGNGNANGRRSGGSHTAGRSVSELLAANGGSGATPRRRRRAED